MDFNDQQISPPTNWQKFEDLCRDIFSNVWGDALCQKNGRLGQAQHGTDIWGTPRDDPDTFHGVQCKGKEDFSKAEITLSELRDEVEKAKSFEPKLKHWVLATTARKDGSIENAARQITAEHRELGLFDVQVLGWEDLRNLLAGYPTVMEKHYRDQAPSTRRIEESLAEIHQSVSPLAAVPLMVQDVQGQIRVLIAALSGHTANAPLFDQADVALQAKIDVARDEFLREFQPGAALRTLTRLKEIHWETASPNARFRLLANMAAAHVNLGLIREGAALCIQGLAYAPNDARAKVNAAMGHFLLGDFDICRSMLDDLLAGGPENDDAIALRILVSVDETTVSDPFWLVKDPNTIAWNVILAAARWYQHRRHWSRALENFKRAHNANPDNAEVMSEAATAVLEDLFKDHVAIHGHTMTPHQREQFAWASAILEKVWERVGKTEAAKQFIATAANLATTFRYRAQMERAEQIIDEALAISPSDAALLQHKAVLVASSGRNVELLLVLDRLDSSVPEAILMRADALGALGRTREALEVLGRFSEGPRVRLNLAATAIRVRVLLVDGQPNVAMDVAARAISRYPASPMARLLVADVHHRNGDHEKGHAEARTALALIGSDGEENVLDRIAVAGVMYAAHDFDGCANAIGPIAGTEEDSEPLRMRVNALLYAERRQELATLLASLPDSIAELPAYSGAGAWLARRVGDFVAARTHLEIYLRHVPRDLRMRLLWWDVVERQLDEAALGEFLCDQTDFFHADVGTRDLMTLAQRLARCGQPGRGLHLGYRVLRERWSEPRAHLGYQRLILMGNAVQSSVAAPASVGPNVAFTVEAEGGHQYTYVVEAESPSILSLGEIALKSPLAARAYGLSVGDSVQVLENPLMPRQKIVALNHKFVSIFQKSLLSFNSMFPEETGMLAFSINPADPGKLVDQIRPMLAARSTAVQMVRETYRTGAVPINVVGEALQADPIDAWSILITGDVLIDVCEGTKVEQDTALGFLRRRPSLILDPLSVWLAGSFGLLDALRDTFGPLGLTATTLDLLRARAADDERVNARSGSMWERDGQIGMVKHSQQYRLERQAREAGIAEWAERNAVIIPAIPASDLSAEMRELGKAMHPTIIDTISAASGSGRVMLAEDRRLRVLAKETANVRGCWLQATMQIARHAGHLDTTLYRNTTVELALHGHRLTTMDAFDLLCAAKRGSWRAEGIFDRILKIATAPTVELNSLSIVAATFSFQMWRRPQARGTKEALIAALLAMCAQTHPKSLPQILGLLKAAIKNNENKMHSPQAKQAFQVARYVGKWIDAWARRQRRLPG